MEGNINIKNKWLHLRLDEAEYKLMISQFKKTTEPHLSKYARKILLGKPMIGRTRDESLHDIIIALNALQKDLNGIGNNYNQMLHKLHMTDSKSEVKAWLIQYELEKKVLFESVNSIKSFITETAKLWLQ